MSTLKAKLAGLALIVALCAVGMLDLTAPAWGDEDELRRLNDLRKVLQDVESSILGFAAYNRGDYATALRELRPLAERGNATAQHNVGIMHGLGRGVPRDDVQAHAWLNLAVSRLSRGEKRDKAAEARDIVAKRMTPAKISEAQKLAREWRPKK